ncbi:MAG: SurA N-terminal domain-containing protein [Bdellovibrionota bacterium]
MLKVIRKAKDSALTKGIFFLLAMLFFVGFLVLPQARRARGGADEIVAIVDGENVYRRDVANAALRMRQGYRDQLGDAYEGLKKYFEEKIPQQAYDQLIESRVAEARARQLGYVTSPEELRRLLMEDESFQVDGKFSRKVYKQFLERNRTTEAEFESTMAKSIALRKIAGMIADQVKVSRAELEQRYIDENTKVTLEVFLLDPTDLAKDVTLTEEEIKKYYDEHTVDYFKPEQREIVYFVYDGSGAPYLGLPEVTKISDEEVEQAYGVSGDKYVLKEKHWRVLDILFATKAKDEKDKRSEEARKKDAKARADAVYARLKTGVPFEETANKESDDLATKRLQNGGELAGGFINAGYFKKKVFEAFSPLQEGGMSEVFEGEDGYHIVKVAKIYEAGTKKPLESVKELIRSSLRNEKAGKLAQQDAEKDLAALGSKSLRDFALEDPEKRRLEVAVVGREDILPKVGKDPELTGKIFDELTPEMRPSLFQSNRKWVLLHVEKKRDPEPAPLAEVKGKIEEILKKEKALEKGRSFAEEIRKEAAGGAKSAALLKKHKALVAQDAGPFPRTGRETATGASGVDVIPNVGSSAELKAAAFALTEKSPLTPAVYNVGEKVGFARLKSRVEADPAGFEAQRKILEQKILEERKNAVYQEWIDKAREHVPVEQIVPAEQLLKELASS